MKDRQTLLHCHAGCSIDDVLAAVSLSRRDLSPKILPSKSQRKKIVATYHYRDESGGLLFRAIRYEPKSFQYRRPVADGGYEWNLAGARLVPYRLPELLSADHDFPVFIVEGEKDVEALRGIGVTATCNPMGALKWRPDYNGHLTGYHCVILPDNDDAGRQHARQVASSIFENAEQVSILELPGLPDKGDVSDWLAAGNTKEDLFALLTGAEVFTGDRGEIDSNPTTDLPERFSLTETGLIYRGENDIFVCSPIRVVANTCDWDHGNWGRLVEFADVKGVEHSMIVPMSALSGDAAEVRRQLMDAGLMISSSRGARQHFLDYLLMAKPDRHVVSVNQLGWHDGAFVLPDGVICKDEGQKAIRMQNVDRGANKSRTNGTLGEWQDHVARFCIGNSRLIFAVSLAFAAAILPIQKKRAAGSTFMAVPRPAKLRHFSLRGASGAVSGRRGFWRRGGQPRTGWKRSRNCTTTRSCSSTRSRRSTPTKSGRWCTRYPTGSGSPG